MNLHIMPIFLAISLSSFATACERDKPSQTPSAPTVVLTDDPPPLPTPTSAPHTGASTQAGALPAGHPPLDTPRMPPPGPVDPNAPLPPGHPPVAGEAPAPGRPASVAGPAVPSEVDVALPLPLEGSGGLTELRARQATLPQALRATFDEAFRLVFTLDRAKRDAARAGNLVAQLLSSGDTMAKAAGHRVAGYLAINRNFDTATALVEYRAAIAADANYGEAHYALAFTLAISDLGAGRAHFDKAIALGVPDTRNLRGQFYAQPE